MESTLAGEQLVLGKGVAAPDSHGILHLQGSN
jgi:hypothetical protein